MTRPSESTDLVVVGEATPLTIGEARDNVLFLVDQFASSWRHTIVNAIELGAALTELKVLTPHGEWLPWIEANFPLGERMAQRFMKMAANASEMSDLPPETPITAAMRWVEARRRLPRPVPETIEDADNQVLPLQRFMVGATPAQVITSIVRTLFPYATNVLDTTYGLGNFHDGTLGLPVTAHDTDATRAPDGTMDVTDLQYSDAVFDIVLFDPLHVADASEDSIMGERYGTMTQEQIDNLIINGTRECWRVCSIAIVVKVTDHVHGQAFQEESATAGEALNWPVPYEKVHQVRERGLIDPRWLEHPRYSAFNNGSTYLVFKKGSQIHGG